MHFKINDQLEIIARAKGEDTQVVARSLCQFMIDKGWILDEQDHYGRPVLECFYPRYISDICLLLARYLGVPTCPLEVFDAFKGLVLWGEGDCPSCGGCLKEKTPEGHELNDGDRWTPNSYVIDYYVYECPVCGEIIKTTEQL